MLPVQSDIRILDKLLALNLSVSLWSARRKMTAEDMGGVNLPPEDLASLGSKRIADPESLKITAVRLRPKKNSPKNPVLCYKDFTQRLNTKGKFGLCRILTHCSPKR